MCVSTCLYGWRFGFWFLWSCYVESNGSLSGGGARAMPNHNVKTPNKTNERTQVENFALDLDKGEEKVCKYVC